MQDSHSTGMAVCLLFVFLYMSFDKLGQTVVFVFVQLQLCRTKIREREWKIALFLNSITEVKSSTYHFFGNEIVVK